MDLQFQIEYENWWATEVALDYWVGFQSRYGTCESIDSDRPLDGKFKLIFAPEGRGAEPLNQYELDLIEWFVDHKQEVSENVMKSVLLAYPGLQESYGYTNDEKIEYMPDVSNIDDFRKLIGLRTVYIHQINKQGIPYIGFEFGCTWDDEHGLGVLMNGCRMVEIGGVETAVLLWIAEEDVQKT